MNGIFESNKIKLRGNTLERINSRLDITKDKISTLQDKVAETLN